MCDEVKPRKALYVQLNLAFKYKRLYDVDHISLEYIPYSFFEKKHIKGKVNHSCIYGVMVCFYGLMEYGVNICLCECMVYSHIFGISLMEEAVVFLICTVMKQKIKMAMFEKDILQKDLDFFKVIFLS